MNNIFKGLKFKYKFRDYQKRVLNDINKYINDDKLNIIAAPGAGKTILALQIMINLNNPTLILSPTIVLREQWIGRLKNDFMCSFNIDEYISNDIFNPNIITVSTYQALYSLYSQKSEKTKNMDIAKILSNIGVKTVILDEAHHLKQAWLEATKSVIQKMKNIKTVSLTATPPYDVDKKLWNNYIELCGEADVEVTVGELVKKENLAPHQDYIFFNDLNENQKLQLQQYKKKVKIFIGELLNNDEFIMSLATNDIIINPSNNLEYILDNFEYYTAILKVLKAKGIEIPKSEWNKLNESFVFINDIEIILKNALFKDNKAYKEFRTLYKEIKKKLEEIGAIDEKEINLEYTKGISDLIAQNSGKLDSIQTILNNEKQKMKEKLKAVIITEDIEKDAINLDTKDMKKIGVIPIFKRLSEDTAFTPIVLTGKIIIVPLKIKDLLLEICKEEKIKEENVDIKELSVNFDYAIFKLLSSDEKKEVNIITKLFEKSDIDTLIGTNALIGEGWDAPFINTLIMATSIAAYVTSNQIRGRAIRTYKLDNNKCANIWHLVSVERKDKKSFILGKDYITLQRRFEAFEGLDLKRDKLGYGIERLDLEDRIYSNSEMKMLNDIMIKNALDRSNTIHKWTKALKNYIAIRKNNIKQIEISQFLSNSLYEEKLTEIYKENKKHTGLKMTFRETANFAKNIILIILFIYFLPSIQIGSLKWQIMMLIICLNFTYELTKKIKRTIDIHGAELEKGNEYLKKISKCLLRTLKELSIIKHSAKLIFDKDNLECYLKRANLKENILFEQALKELLGTIENPRYIITNGQRIYQVPNIIGKNKANVARLYYNVFNSKNMATIYTGTPKGKEILLKLKIEQNNSNGSIIINDKKLSPTSNYDTSTIISNQDINIDIDIMKDILESKELLKNKEEKK